MCPKERERERERQAKRRHDMSLVGMIKPKDLCFLFPVLFHKTWHFTEQNVPTNKHIQKRQSQHLNAKTSTY